jgi:hypothetical protein
MESFVDLKGFQAAFKDLECFTNDVGIGHARRSFLFCAVGGEQSEYGVAHLLLCRFAWVPYDDAIAQVSTIVGNETQGAQPRSTEIDSRVAVVATVEDHLVTGTGNAVREAKGVGTEVHLSCLGDGTDKHDRHREEGRSLVEIVQDADGEKAVVRHEELTPYPFRYLQMPEALCPCLPLFFVA